MPVGIIRPFWLPAMVTSMPQASILYSMLPSEEIVSESSSAGCLAWSIARRTSASGSTMPVAVSLWTASTALISWLLSAARRSLSLANSSALAPVGADDLDLEAERLGELLEAQREVAGLDHQHEVAGREQVGDRRLPGAVAGRGVEEDLLVGLQDALHAAVAGALDLEELRREEVHDRPVHRPQHAVGNVGRAGIVEELAAARLGVHLSGQGKLRSAKSRAGLAAGPWRSKRGLRCSGIS